MPSNIEIKAVLSNRAAAEAVAARLSGAPPQTFQQEDFFFHCDGARLKLRILQPNHGELIRYERDDIADACRSRYLIARTADPKILLDILTATLNRTGVVKKTRTLYFIGQTRVHLDRVEGLGEFLELEVVLQPSQSEREGENIAAALLADFGIDKQQVVGEAYIDLLLRQTGVALTGRLTKPSCGPKPHSKPQ
jgi:predicted adenylyl cyclase CyaB